MAFLDFIPILGDVVNAITSHKEAKQSRNWQEEMSNTAYQRQVKDLNAAGLNPMLGYMKGSGATTPGGAKAEMPDFGRGIRETQQNVASRSLMATQEQVARTGADLNSANAVKALSEAKLADAQALNVPLTGANVSAQTDKFRMDLDVARSEIERLKSVTKGQDLTNTQIVALSKALADLHRAEAGSTRAGIPEKEARGSVAEIIRNGADMFRKLPTNSIGSNLGMWLEDTIRGAAKATGKPGEFVRKVGESWSSGYKYQK